MKALKWIVTVAALFAPLILFGYAFGTSANGARMMPHLSLVDWIWFIALDAMMLGFYYLCAVFFENEEEIEEEFQSLDRDHDGFISRDDARGSPVLALAFDKYDADHDGRLSRVEFENLEHAVMH